jgi:PadR family transcriptional regulator PadR
MPRYKDQLQGTLDLLVLRTLAAGGALHGYAISERIQLVSREALRVEEGSLYPALHRTITAAGQRELAEVEAEWTRLVGGVARVLKQA